MKSALAALLLLPVMATATDAPLCTGWKSSVDKDLRITEADLTKSRAEKAAAFMSAYVQAEGRTGEEQDAEHAMLLLEAYMRRQQMLLAPRSPEATRAFCGWLMKQAWSE